MKTKEVIKVLKFIDHELAVADVSVTDMTREEYIEYLEEDYYRRKELEGQELMMHQTQIHEDREIEKLESLEGELEPILGLEEPVQRETGVLRPKMMQNLTPESHKQYKIDRELSKKIDDEVEKVVKEARDELSLKKNQRVHRVLDSNE